MMNETYDYLLEKYGFDSMVLKMVEEQSEFMTALLHLPKTKDYEKVYDELSDLMIMQDRLIHALDCYNRVNQFKIMNMLELKERVKSGQL